MKSSSISWEIILTGLVLTAIGIYVIRGRSHAPEAFHGNDHPHIKHPEPPAPPSPPQVVIDIQNLDDLKNLDKLKELKNVKDLDQLRIKLKKNLKDVINEKEVEASLKKLDENMSKMHDNVDIKVQGHKVLIQRRYNVKPGSWQEVSPGVYVYKEQLDPANLKKMNLRLGYGHINLQGNGSEQPELTLKVTGNFDSPDELRKKLNLDVESSGGQTNIDVSSKSRFSFFDNTNLNATVILPENTNVQAKTSGGHISARDLHGTEELKTSGGHITLEDLSGQISANTSGGHINTENLDGDIQLVTSGGHISIDHLKGHAQAKTSGGHISLSDIAGSIAAKTSGGNIDANISNVVGDLSFSTSAGNISIHLPSDAKADLALKGMRTSLNGNFNFSGTKKDNEIVGSINGGGPSISANCSFGNVSVQSQ